MVGTLSQKVLTSDTKVDLSFDVYFINAKDNSVTVDLPDVTTLDGVLTYFKRIDTAAANTVTIRAHGTQLIDGEATTVLSTLGCVKLTPFGGNCYILTI